MRAFLQHAAKNLQLTFIELIFPAVKQSGFLQRELDLFLSLDLRLKRDVDEPGYPRGDVVRLLAFFQRVVIVVPLGLD